MIYFFKKFVSKFLFPVPLVGGLMLMGLFFLLSKRWQRPRLGRSLLVTGTVLYFLFHYYSFSNMLLEPIEYKYLAHLPNSSVGAEKLDPPPEFIIVFAASIYLNADTPVTSRMESACLSRLLETVRLHRIYPDARVIVSLCDRDISFYEKRRMLDEFAEIVGVDSESIDIITGALNTNDEVNQFRKIVGDKRVIAVSSASHIPRIMMMLKRNNMNAVPAPCGHNIMHGDNTRRSFNPWSFFPSSGSMDHAEAAIYEWMGMLWELMTG